MSDRIEVGDKVSVCWDDNGLIEGIVLHAPTAAGESWIIETEKAICYVQNFQMVWKAKPTNAGNHGPA